MGIRYTSLIFFLVFCGNCILMTWSASNEDDRNLPLVKRGKSPWECFQRSPRSARVTMERKEDKKEKEIAVESIPAKAKTSTAGRSGVNMQWTREQKEDLVHHFHVYHVMRASKGPEELRDWKKITAAWSEKHGNLEKKKLKTYAFSLRGKMHAAAKHFDDENPEKCNIDWTGTLNDDLMKIYYLTKAGDESRHGERMLAEWVRKKLPGYQNLKSEYLLNRAKVMFQSIGSTSSSDLHGGTIVKKRKKRGSKDFIVDNHVNWKPEQDKYLLGLLNEKRNLQDVQLEGIHRQVVGRFPQLRALPATQVYDRVRYLWDKKQEHQQVETSYQRTMQGSHAQYHMFIDDRNFPLLNQERITSTSSHPGLSHEQSDLEMGLKTLNVRENSPDTNLRLR